VNLLLRPETNFVTLSVFDTKVPVSRTALPRTVVFDQDTDTSSGVERGVSVDQDGKSNVWAIEPKMEISDKSDEEKTTSVLIAGGGLAAFAVLAGVALTNLPDPNQF
jgi:hypothetical protein